MVRCAFCQVDNPDGMRFCGGCGKPLAARPAADRRQLTVMFCDLVGSTALADRLDPEELVELVRAYQDAAGQAINRFDGHVAQHLGDGLLVYFGYPTAHEDDARRAVLAALDTLDAIADLNTRLDASRQLAVRIGIHTGPVVTGDVGGSAGRAERLALGATPNVAARLQSAAEPGAILISRQTRELLKGDVEVAAVGALALKGVAQPVDAFRVLGQAAMPAPSGAARLMGREIEGRILDELFAEAAGGRRRAALVVGEPGLGKSVLVQAACERIGSARASIAFGHCSAYDVDTALAPMLGAAEDLFGLAGLGPDARTSRLSAMLDAGPDEWSSADLALLAGLFGGAPVEPAAVADLSPQRRKDLAFAALANAIRERGRERTVLLVIEDLHWADPSTVEFLGFLLGSRTDARLLLVMTARPTFEPAWSPAEATRIDLGPLSPTDVRAIVGEVSGGRSLAPALVAEIIARTDGVPLYVEELTKSLLEGGATDAQGESAAPIPTSLQASLTARLDRLGPAREVAQVASVIGREFSREMLRAAGDWPEADLDAHLSRLVLSQLVQEPGGGRYLFRHALIRDAAYDLLLKSARREHHRRIADALIERFPDRVTASPGLVARHFTEAGAAAEAVPYWMRAGRKAAGESANLEAIHALRSALDLVRQLPASTGRDLQELETLLAIGPPLTMTRGFVVDEVEQTYLRAQELNERVGDPRQQIWIGIGLTQFRLVRGEIEPAHQIGLRLVEQAVSLGDPAYLPRALVVPAITSYYAGRFREATDWQARARAQLGSADEMFLNLIGLDLDALLAAYEAMTAWHLGRPDTGLARGREAVNRARRTGRSNALSHALVFAGLHLHHFRREPADVLRLSAEVAALSAEYGLPIWGLQAGLWQLWALSLLEPGRAEAGEDTPASLQLIRTYQSTGSGLALAYFMTIAIETLWRRGRLDLAGRLIDEALAFNTSRTDPMWDAEIRRLKGEFQLVDPSPESRSAREDEAAARFADAIATASRQESRSLHLRALTSLVRLRARQRRPDDSRTHLQSLLEGFTEGGDTADVIDARAALAATD